MIIVKNNVLTVKGDNLTILAELTAAVCEVKKRAS